MTHILVFLGEFFDENSIKKFIECIRSGEKYFNCEAIDGVELENNGGEGTAGSHWEARILFGDYMNGVDYTEEEIFRIYFGFIRRYWLL